MDWFLYDKGLRHERVKLKNNTIFDHLAIKLSSNVFRTLVKVPLSYFSPNLQDE